MAKLLADSFDFYSNASDFTAPGGIWSVNNASTGVTSSTRFGTGKAATWGNAQDAIAPLDVTSSNVVFIHVAVLLGSSAAQNALTLMDATGSQVSIQFDTVGTVGAITVRGGALNATTIATFSSAFAASVWNHYQIKVVIHPSAGEVHIRMNGATTDTFSATGLNTRNSGASNVATRFNFKGNSGAIDDLFVNDDAGSTNNDFMGDIRAYTLSPNAAGASTNFTPLAGNNYANVAELVNDGDSTYNFSSNVGDIDLYNLANLPSSPPSVSYVQVRGFMKKTDTGARSGQVGVSSGGTSSFASALALATTYQMQRVGFDLDPNTSAAWTATAVNALQVGFKVAA